MKPKLLDAFCKAGGAGMGYYRAGFEVIGIDIEPQPRYPFKFYQANALEFIPQYGHEFILIHTSPPCQLYSVTASLSNGNHPDLINETRRILQATGKPYVIENVPGAPLINPLMLCGTMFGLRIIRHRLFETSPIIWWPPASCCHWGRVAPSFGKGTYDKSGYDFITVAGKGFPPNIARSAMDIDWMIGTELAQAIPPAYTEWLGKRLLEKLRYSHSHPITFA